MIKILVVDDDDSVRDIIKNFLHKISREFDTYTVSNGMEALEVVKNKDIYLIISDIDMPIMDGFQFLKELEKINNNTGVIMMSGINYADEFDKVKNVFGFLKKPLEIDDLAQLTLKFYAKQGV